MIRVELVDEYGYVDQASVLQFENFNGGQVEWRPQVFGWPWQWKVRVTMQPDTEASTASPPEAPDAA